MRTNIVIGALFLSLTMATGPVLAKSPSLIGSWRGGGILQPANGARQRARCRVTIHKAPARGYYNASFRCSTTSGMVNQSARLKKLSSNRYRGTFYNAQYKVRGVISSVLRGNRQSVTMRSNAGSGRISLHR